MDIENVNSSMSDKNPLWNPWRKRYHYESLTTFLNQHSKSTNQGNEGLMVVPLAFTYCMSMHYFSFSNN